jgi:hypothetical protein
MAGEQGQAKPEQEPILKESAMAKAKRWSKQPTSKRLMRVKLSAEESLKRMEEFPKRKARFIAAIRKSR